MEMKSGISLNTSMTLSPYDGPKLLQTPLNRFENKFEKQIWANIH